MFNRNRDRNRRLATLAGIGLGVALLRKGRMRRYAMWRMMGGGFGPGSWGRGPWSRGQWGPPQGADFSQMPLPPFIEARLKAWHDKAHGNVPTPGTQSSETAQV